MTRERWEVRHPEGDVVGRYSTRAEAAKHATVSWLARYRLRIVRVRTFAVVSVWAWKSTRTNEWYRGEWKNWGVGSTGRTLYPTRAAALVARPSADAVLVRIRRMVRE